MKKLIFLFISFLFFISCKSTGKTNDVITNDGSVEKFSFQLQDSSQKLLVKKSVSVANNEFFILYLSNEFLINRNISVNDNSILINKEILVPEENSKKGFYIKQYPVENARNSNLYHTYRLKSISPDNYLAENSITGEVFSSDDSINYNPVVKTLIKDFYTDKNSSVPFFLSLCDYSFSCEDNKLSILMEDDYFENISELINKTTDYNFSGSEYKDFLLNSEYCLNELTTETFNEYQFTINLLNDKTFQMFKEYPFEYELRLLDNKKPIYIPTSFHFWKSYDPTEFALKGGCDFYNSRKIPALPKSIKKISIGYFIRCTKELKIINCHWSRQIIYNNNGREIPVTYTTEYTTTN